jgi:hypothetical protein
MLTSIPFNAKAAGTLSGLFGLTLNSSNFLLQPASIIKDVASTINLNFMSDILIDY